MNKHETKYFNTEKKLFRAFLELLEHNDFDSITVSAICEQAGVYRSTFYSHFENTKELFDKLYIELIERFEQELEEQNHANLKEEGGSKDNSLIREEVLLPYLKFLKAHKQLMSIIARETSLFDLQGNDELLKKNILYPATRAAGYSDEKKVEYLIEYYVFGVRAIIFKWLSENCTETEEEIVNIIRSCILNCK